MVINFSGRFNGYGKAPPRHFVVLRLELFERSGFYGTPAFVVSDKSTLLGLERFMIANFHQRFDDVLKGMDVVVEKD